MQVLSFSKYFNLCRVRGKRGTWQLVMPSRQLKYAEHRLGIKIRQSMKDQVTNAHQNYAWGFKIKFKIIDHLNKNSGRLRTTGLDKSWQKFR